MRAWLSLEPLFSNGKILIGLCKRDYADLMTRQRLSDLTGNPEYGDLAQKAESFWFTGKEIWPGLTGANFSVQTGEIIDQYGGWTSGTTALMST